MKTLISFLVFILAITLACTQKTKYVQPDLGTRQVKLLEADGFQFKDLNKNNQLDFYEDWRLTPEERAENLLSIIPLKPKTKIYLEKHMVSRDSDNPHTIVMPDQSNWDIEFVNTADESDVVVLWLIPKTGGLFDSQSDDIFLLNFQKIISMWTM